ncbi:sigma-70 family RNA polymerase sigma factor [Verrucomicrobium sp. BvORR034]|uniref:sigma-70 family RNA polymerase sigma factor n=1 Tax=Verrucomicrobium sp. BvORR034 TaxID=1396418 RepID=UPI0006785264|nr:sigma-70 family RNA polymerase sigma factor [Verrucomicrobium sp. BvORR034]
MYADYLRVRSLAKVGAIWGRSRQSMHELLASRRQTLKRKMHIPVVYGGQSYTPGKNGYLRRTCRKGHGEHLLQRVVWMDHHGPIPHGWNVVFKDGDKRNCSIDNLECLPVAVASGRNSTGENQHTRNAQLKLITLVDPWIVRQANIYAQRFHADPKELIQIGTLEAMRLTKTWSPTGGASFFTYSCRAITRSIRIYATKQASPVTFPSRKSHLARIVYLDAPVGDGPDAETLLDVAFGTNENITHSIETKELFEAVEKLLPQLPERQRLVLQKRFFDQATYREIGMQFNLSHERVRQIEQGALSHLRRHLTQIAA